MSIERQSKFQKSFFEKAVFKKISLTVFWENKLKFKILKKRCSLIDLLKKFFDLFQRYALDVFIETQYYIRSLVNILFHFGYFKFKFINFYLKFHTFVFNNSVGTQFIISVFGLYADEFKIVVE